MEKLTAAELCKLSRPALGKIAVGDKVFVYPNTRLGRSRDFAPMVGQVILAGRVWVTIRTEKGADWKMRLDSQTDGSQYRAARFVTPEQREFDDRRIDAESFLLDNGIRLEFDSPWREPGPTRALALVVWMLSSQVQLPEAGA